MYIFLLAALFAQVYTACVNDVYNCFFGFTYYLANRRDCTRFTKCSQGHPNYLQCRKRFVFNFCQQKCVPVLNREPRFECLRASMPGCVMQVERPYDPLQAVSNFSSNVQVPSVPPLVPQKGAGPARYIGMQPYGNGYNSAYGSSGMGINLNFGFLPYSGWMLNAQMGMTSPWTAFLPYPSMYNGDGSVRQVTEYTSPGMSGIDDNAVPVSPCVPIDPWPQVPTAIPAGAALPPIDGGTPKPPIAIVGNTTTNV